MRPSRKTLRLIALTGLWALVGLVLWLMTVQIMLVALAPGGAWQKPGIAKVTIQEIDNDPQSQFTDIRVKVAGDGEDEDGGVRVISLLRPERANLRVDDEIWILDHFYRTRLRPGQFLLTPKRLVLEFPEPFLVLALLAIAWLRRGQAREDQAERERPGRVRQVVRDDFHKRAQRFADRDDKPDES